MDSKKEIRKKINLISSIGFLLSIIGLISIIYMFLSNYENKKVENEYIESYIKNYNNKGNIISEKNNSNGDSNFQYIAILDIPKINLKKGLVMSTKNFKSINYAISIDKNSKMPDKKGYFILYAHSGNSRISYFKDINKLEKDDIAKVFYQGKTYNYKVNKKYEIQKTGSLILNENYDVNNLVLLTCIHNTKKQLVIICTLESVI